ncbi:MAG: aquaporin [Thermaerobacter sp.]|nr:aquaporin [Thermaerobacter sp.]
MKKYLAEFIGTFLLTTVIAGSVMMDAISRSSTANVPFVVFLVLMVLVYTIGPISGAHVNPAVTLGVFALGKIPGRDVVGYIVAQLIGAIVASLVLLAILGHVASLGATVPVAGWGDWRGAALEALLTFGLVFAVSMTFHPKFPPLASGLAVGGALGLGAFWGGALTGGSMNPARTLGPALVSGQFASIWIYIVGPIVGAIVAALVVRYLLLNGEGAEAPAAKRARR